MPELAPPRILFLVAHPHLLQSRANRAVVEAVRRLAPVTLHRLYDRYPYFHIDVAHEKGQLLAHDLIVVQHPLYWYSMPALLKLWLDEVLDSGWAYGPGGDRLKGKKFLLSITAGGSPESYSTGGYNRFSLETLLAPWNQTVHLCQMQWCAPSILHNSIETSDQELLRHADGVCERLQRYLTSGELA